MSENRYGVDVAYFKRELSSLSRSLPNRTPDELGRYLRRLADIVSRAEAPATDVNVERRNDAAKVLSEYGDACIEWDGDADEPNEYKWLDRIIAALDPQEPSIGGTDA